MATPESTLGNGEDFTAFQVQCSRPLCQSAEADERSELPSVWQTMRAVWQRPGVDPPPALYSHALDGADGA